VLDCSARTGIVAHGDQGAELDAIGRNHATESRGGHVVTRRAGRFTHDCRTDTYKRDTCDVLVLGIPIKYPSCFIAKLAYLLIAPRKRTCCKRTGSSSRHCSPWCLDRWLSPSRTLRWCSSAAGPFLVPVAELDRARWVVVEQALAYLSLSAAARSAVERDWILRRDAP